MYRIGIGKNVEGVVVFCVATPDGNILIPWRELGDGCHIDTSSLNMPISCKFGVGGGMGGGMGGGPSDGNREGKTLLAVHAAVPSPPWRESAADMGLQIVSHDDWPEICFYKDGKVLAQWWPSTGSTMLGGTKGPKCKTGEDVIAWLKNL